ncbi:MAG: class I adenylate-forming enzyme family protein, partial [Candidatus Limnocylindria bacterium]
MNPLMLLEMAAAGFGERVAVQNGPDRLTYAELFAAAAAARRQIEASGAAHVGILDVNSLAVPVGLFAAAWAGRPFVPLNYRLTADEVDALVARIAPAYLVADPERIERLAALPGASAVARDRFLAGLAGAGPANSDWPADPDAIAVLLFTSGTTGAPKAAVLRNRHLVSYILGSVEFGAAAEDEAALVSVPPYHVAAMAAILSSVYAGRRMVQLASFSPEAWVDTARAERVTHAFVVPTMLTRIVDALEAAGATLPALRALSYGGGKMPLPVIERAMRLLPGVDFTNAYGLTETSSTISLLGPEDHRLAAASDEPAVRRRLASVGRALPGVEIEVRDEDGKPVAPGAPGEIHVRGEQVSGEYQGRAATLGPEGWFPTRDGGFLDHEGYLFVTGRIDDVIVRGGENLSPGEIEDVLHEHPGVADCAVVGVPDEQWGEAVAAVIVPRAGARPDPEELRAWVRARLR